MSKSVHQAVLQAEVLEHLSADGGTYLDCTLGGAGHSRLILEQNPTNQVYAIDRDPLAIERAKDIEAEYPGRFIAQQASFSDLEEIFINIKFDGILADFGISSDQLLVGRGFSFSDSESLDMRMDTSMGQTAAELINQSSKAELVRILRRGDVKGDLNAISNSILKHRPFVSAEALANAVDGSVRASTNNKKKIHPATLVLQAIRIEVNQELQQIEDLLSVSQQLIAPGGRLVVISFHSLEDKLVTRQFRKWSRRNQQPALWAGKAESQEVVLGELVTAQAVKATDHEVEMNSRARSARLRSFKFN